MAVRVKNVSLLTIPVKPYSTYCGLFEVVASHFFWFFLTPYLVILALKDVASGIYLTSESRVHLIELGEFYLHPRP